MEKFLVNKKQKQKEKEKTKPEKKKPTKFNTIGTADRL